MRTALLLTSLIIAAALPGCASDPAQVSDSEMTEIRRAASTVTPGMSRDQALAAFKGAKERLGTSRVGESQIEEWQVSAYTEDRKGKDEKFLGYLYFLDDVLVDVSDVRIDYRANADLLGEWGRTSGATGAAPDPDESGPDG